MSNTEGGSAGLPSAPLETHPQAAEPRLLRGTAQGHAPPKTDTLNSGSCLLGDCDYTLKA